MSVHVSDRCEVCHRVLTERPDPKRRRCAEHLAQLDLFPRGAVRKPRSRPGRRLGRWTGGQR